MKFNRRVLSEALKQGIPLCQAVNRCTGRTTAAILEALANSYKYPGKQILIHDPDALTERTRRCLLSTATDLIARLGFSDLSLIKTDKAVYIVNTFCEDIHD